MILSLHAALSWSCQGGGTNSLLGAFASAGQCEMWIGGVVCCLNNDKSKIIAYKASSTKAQQIFQLGGAVIGIMKHPNIWTYEAQASWDRGAQTGWKWTSKSRSSFDHKAQRI
ncbi:uncharacterized protein MELLADRAFT_108830 [Melampsora larici-populina 98AG31]|uniref:Uncharacterized protein n=1 Tax=Melampsora larici-populina (strain 98AG31 / pathotype 3-4-7) TaxID=747676 RepID=F4RUE7_MELLP|nr:uncharacterized protein MELLADRAFT_108830 [Melampsora larici-populina 98AG31]EGG03921.1 hypothetical protein MELLADRAFT_108830 [Melampsora larici-populina 98AG31]